MNSRGTTLYLCLLLTVLWLFGLMLAFKKTSVDESFVVPTLQKSDAKIDYVHIARRDLKPESTTFVKSGDQWYLQLSGGQKTRVELFRVDPIIRQITNARKSDDAGVSYDLAGLGLQDPSIVVTLKGAGSSKKQQEWKFNVGIETPAKSDYFVNSSDIPEQAVAVRRSSIEALFFTDLSTFRPQRLLDVSENSLQALKIQSSEREVAFERNGNGTWKFATPNYGLVDLEGIVSEKKTELKNGGFKGLIGQLATLRVEEGDFVPLDEGDPAKLGLVEGKETLRITATTSEDKKKDSTETLLVGDLVKDKYYVRWADDPGVGRIAAKQLDPILAVLREPGSLRNLDIASFDPKKIDEIDFRIGADEIHLKKSGFWEMDAAGQKNLRANDKVVESVLELVQGKRAIQKFFNGADKDKMEAEFAKSAASIEVFAKADKKDEKQPAETAKILSLAFGIGDKEQVPVKRVSVDGVTSYFAISKSTFDKIVPQNGYLAFLEPYLPGREANRVASITLQRGKETVHISRGEGGAADRWLLGDPKEKNVADFDRVENLLQKLLNTPVKKWIKKVDAKDDLGNYGLNSPEVIATLQVRRTHPDPAWIASFLGEAAVAGVAAMIGIADKDPGEKIELRFGKEGPEKLGVYARSSDSNLLFLASPELVKLVAKEDLRDRGFHYRTQARIDAGAVAVGSPQFLAWLPWLERIVQSFDPAHVRSVKIDVRSFELRKFQFVRSGPDQPWQDQSNLAEFQLDPAKVTALVELWSHWRARRIVQLSGPFRSEYRLDPKDATLQIELTLDGGRTVQMTVGGPFGQEGYFAQTSTWPGAVFLVDSDDVASILRGPAYFGKERHQASE